MSKKINYIFLSTLIIFSIYCALTVGETWDQKDSIIRGKVTLEYLLSLGRIDTNIIYRENYSSIYWSILYFVTEIFPKSFEIQISNLVNLFFSLLTVFGIAKLSKELFNKKVGEITFLILFSCTWTFILLHFLNCFFYIFLRLDVDFASFLKSF